MRHLPFSPVGSFALRSLRIPTAVATFVGIRRHHAAKGHEDYFLFAVFFDFFFAAFAAFLFLAIGVTSFLR